MPLCSLDLKVISTTVFRALQLRGGGAQSLQGAENNWEKSVAYIF